MNRLNRYRRPQRGRSNEVDAVELGAQHAGWGQRETGWCLALAPRLVLWFLGRRGSEAFQCSPDRTSIQFSSIQFNSIQFNSIQFNSIQFNSIQFNSIQFSSIQFNSIQFNSIQFSSIQFNSIQFNSIQFHSISLHFVAFHCFIWLVQNILSFPKTRDVRWCLLTSGPQTSDTPEDQRISACQGRVEDPLALRCKVIPAMPCQCLLFHLISLSCSKSTQPKP